MSEAARGEDLTRLLSAWQGGDREAAERLFPLVYDHLRTLARRQMAKGASDTLETSGVVNEAYLKLVESTGLEFADRGHFFAVASKAMRQILVDHARRHAARKRGGDRVRVELDESHALVDRRATEVLAIDQALERLEHLDTGLVRLTELRFFAGLSIEETAGVLEVSPTTVKREWKKARAFLSRELATEGV